MKSPITTHVLDTSRGRPAANLKIVLETRSDSGTWTEAAKGVTDKDGRVSDLLKPGGLKLGVHRLIFDTGAYFAEQGQSCFYPHVDITFSIHEAAEHYHVPLLLSPFGYSTYRGS